MSQNRALEHFNVWSLGRKGETSKGEKGEKAQERENGVPGAKQRVFHRGSGSLTVPRCQRRREMRAEA